MEFMHSAILVKNQYTKFNTLVRNVSLSSSTMCLLFCNQHDKWVFVSLLLTICLCPFFGSIQIPFVVYNRKKIGQTAT